MTHLLQRNVLLFLTGTVFLGACQSPSAETKGDGSAISGQVQATFVTDSLAHDSDDPAIWVNPQDPSKSIIIGTDKDREGALYAFDLEGKIIDSLVVRGIQRPNNVDIGYGLDMGEAKVDFVVTGERLTSRLRFFSLPLMREINEGGIEVFQDEQGEGFRDLMGVAVYFDSSKGKHYVVAGRKNGPQDGTYLWQYEIIGKEGKIELDLVRKFGAFSGKKEIEAIAVDEQLGYIYYSDEGVGVRKYHADPVKGNEELALFATEGFVKDHEGISIYKLDDRSGYILVSDQEANRFHVFSREGTKAHPHQHDLVTVINTSTVSSDGSEVVSVPLNETFKKGLFVAMSDDRTFQLYKWEDLAGDTLKTIK
ncbi:phytase [Echinicola sediminis]